MTKIDDECQIITRLMMKSDQSAPHYFMQLMDTTSTTNQRYNPFSVILNEW